MFVGALIKMQNNTTFCFIMIPIFESSGNLPQGIHVATIEEFEARFSNTIKRKQLFEKLIEIIDLLRKFDCEAIYVDGSYVTNKRLPKDIDICWEDVDESGNELYDFAELMAPILFAPREEQQKKYKADILPAHFKSIEKKKFFINYFQQDKTTQLPKGIIKIKIH